MKRKFIFLNLLVVGMLALTALMALASPPGSPPAQQATPTQRVVPTVPPPTRVPTRMPAGDLARVRAAGTLVVGTSLDNPPFSGVS